MLAVLFMISSVLAVAGCRRIAIYQADLRKITGQFAVKPFSGLVCSQTFQFAHFDLVWNRILVM